VKRRRLLITVPLLLGLLGWGCGTLRLEGMVAVKGNAPHVYLVLVTGDDTEYALVGPLAEQISREYQGRTIRVEGRIVKESPAPGIPAELEVVRVLGVRRAP
jgi:hypothetical protein